MYRWKAEFLVRVPEVFASGADKETVRLQDQVAELERLVGRLTMQLEIAKKSLALLEVDARRKRAVARILKETYPVTAICQTLELSRSTFYQRARVTDETELRAAIETVVAAHPTYGSRRIAPSCGTNRCVRW